MSPSSVSSQLSLRCQQESAQSRGAGSPEHYQVWRRRPSSQVVAAMPRYQWNLLVDHHIRRLTCVQPAVYKNEVGYIRERRAT